MFCSWLCCAVHLTPTSLTLSVCLPLTYHPCRSRALWLAALVDPEGVSSLVGMELRTRLREIFEANDSQSQGQCQG